MRAAASQPLSPHCSQIPEIAVQVLVNWRFHTITLPASATVFELKARVEEQSGLPADSHFLSFRGLGIEGDRSQMDYNMSGDTKVTLMYGTAMKHSLSYIKLALAEAARSQTVARTPAFKACIVKNIRNDFCWRFHTPVGASIPKGAE